MPPRQQIDYSLWDHVLSFSQFENWSLCRRKWWWRAIVRMPEQKKETREFGDTVHEVLERWLRADDQGRNAEGKPVDLYPEGWDKKVSPTDAALVRALVQKSIDEGVIVRRPGRVIEHGFVKEIVPGLAIQGFIDVAYPDDLEVQDHKTTKRRQYVKTVDQLRHNDQLTIYAKVIMDETGAPPTATFKMRHNAFVRSPARVVQVGPVEIGGEAVLKFWNEELTPAAKEMLKLKQKGLTEEQWRQVPGPIDEDESCRAYGGCDYLPICSGRQSPSDLRRVRGGLSFTQTTQSTGDSKVAPSVMDKLLAAGRGTTATPPPTTVTQTTAAPAAPPAQVAVVPPPAVKTAGLANLDQIGQPARLVPPWANAACNSCKGSGFNMKTGQPCFPCGSMAAMKKNGTAPDDFTVQIVDGLVFWRNANGNVRGDMKLDGYVAPKLEVREEQAPAAPVKTLVQLAKVAPLAALAAAAGNLPVVNTTAPVVTTGLAAITPPFDPDSKVDQAAASLPVKRGRGRPRKVVLPPAPTAEAPAPAVVDKALEAGSNVTIPTRDESSLVAAVEQPKVANLPLVTAPPRAAGFILVFGAVQMGGVGVAQLPSQDMARIIRERLAPQLEQAIGKSWWQMPVYERRDALIQRAREISTTLTGIITVENMEGEAASLARALIPFADAAFITVR